jgi:hypothetical protein
MTLSGDDRAALADLVHRYAALVDDRQFASVPDLFTADAELILPDPPTTLEPARHHHGQAAIEAAVGAVAATIRTQHAIIGEVYDPGTAADTAHGRISCIAHHWIRHDDQIRDVTWHLRYYDDYLRTTEWRIRRRVLTIDAIDTRPIHQVRQP